MSSGAEKTNRSSTVVQQKAQHQSFFRKAGEESFFGTNEQPSFFSRGIQAKLSVSSPDDPQEKEADAVADNVMRMQEPAIRPLQNKDEDKLQKKEEEEEVQAKPETTGVNCIQCKESDDDEVQPNLFRKIQRSEERESERGLLTEERSGDKQEQVNRKNISLHQSDVVQMSGRGPPTGSIPFEHTLSSSKGAGSVLPANTRRFMENRLQADFSGVRVHTGSNAESMSRRINAQAFTHGNDIYFNSGKYAPHTREGGTLLAHELTHTVQQGASRQNENTSQQNNDTRLDQPTSSIENESQGEARNTVPSSASNVTATGETVTGRSGPNNNQATNEDALAISAVGRGQETEQGLHNESTGIPSNQVSHSNDVVHGERNSPSEEQTQPNEPLSQQTSSEPEQTASASGGDPGKATAHEGGDVHTPVGEEQPQTAAKQEGTSSSSSFVMNRLMEAKESDLKNHALTQAELVNADYFSSTETLNRVNLERKQQIRSYFAGIRLNILAFFIGNILIFQNTVRAFQQTLTGSINSAILFVHTLITGLASLLFARITAAIINITSAINGALSRISERVNSIVGRITNVIDSVSLPDLPGVATVRNIIQGAINTAAGFVMRAISGVQSFIHLVLSAALQVITSLLVAVTRVINRVLTIVITIVNRVLRNIFRTLQRLIRLVATILLRILFVKIWPKLIRMELKLIATVDKLHQKALAALKENRLNALETLAGLVGNTGNSSNQERREGPGLSTNEIILEIRNIGTNAIKRNAEIVSSYEQDTSSLWMLILHQISAVAARIMAEVIIRIMRVISSVLQTVTRLILTVWGFIHSVIATINQYIQHVIAAIGVIINTVINFIRHPIDSLVAFAQNAWSRITSFVSNAVRRFINGLLNLLSPVSGTGSLGLFAPAFVPALAPAPAIIIIVIGIVVIGGVTIIFLEGGLVLILIGSTAIILTYGEFVVLVILLVIVAVIVILLLLLLLYLLLLILRWLIRRPLPRPRPRPKKCRPGEIFDPAAPSGLLPSLSDRIKITWFKPLSAYHNPINMGGSDYFMSRKKALPPPLDFIIIGVDAINIPFIGKTMLIFHQRNRGQEAKFKRRLRAAGYSWSAFRTSPDHVMDLMWNGPDEFENLWPLDSGINSRAGTKQNIDQQIYFRPDSKRPCAVLMPLGLARAIYPMSTRRFVINSFKLP